MLWVLLTVALSVNAETEAQAHRSAPPSLFLQGPAISALDASATDAGALQVQAEVQKPKNKKKGAKAAKAAKAAKTEKIEDAAPTPAPAPGNPADEKNRQIFVRECTVAFMSDNEEMLPTGVVEELCAKTDVVVECKLATLKKLQETRLGHAGDITGWCAQTYDWYASRYGMHCPSQCDKAQCKETCRWLEKVDKVHAKMDETQKDADDLEDLYGEVEKWSRLKKGYDEDLSRATVDAENKMETFRAERTTADKEKEEMNAAITRRQEGYKLMGKNKKKMQAAENEVKVAKEALLRQNRKTEMAKQDVINMKNARAKAKARAETLEAKLPELTAEIKDGNEDVTELNREIGEHEKVKAALKAMMEKQSAVVTEWEGKLTKAKAELAKVTSGEQPKDVLAASQDLVEQQRSRRNDEQDKLHDLDSKLTKATTMAKLANEKLQALSESITQKNKELEMATSDATEARKEEESAGQKVQNKEDWYDAQVQKVKVKETSLEKKKKDLATKKANFAHATNVFHELEEKKNKAAADRKVGTARVQAAYKIVKAAQEVKKKAKDLAKKAAKKVDELSEEYKTSEAKVRKQMDTQNQAAAKYFRGATDIAREHGMIDDVKIGGATAAVHKLENALAAR